MANIRYLNLKSLLTDMESKKYIITSFGFSYNGVTTMVVFKRIVRNRQVEADAKEYAKADVLFIREDNNDWVLNGYIDFWNIHFGNMDEAYLFFGISGSKCGNWDKDYIPDLSVRFTDFVPSRVQDIHSDSRLMANGKDRSYSEDGEKLYCYKIARAGTKADGTPKKRTDANTDKTKKLRRDLYEMFKDDPYLCFYYTADKSKEKKLYEIAKRFSYED